MNTLQKYELELNAEACGLSPEDMRVVEMIIDQIDQANPHLYIREGLNIDEGDLATANLELETDTEEGACEAYIARKKAEIAKMEQEIVSRKIEILWAVEAAANGEGQTLLAIRLRETWSRMLPQSTDEDRAFYGVFLSAGAVAVFFDEPEGKGLARLEEAFSGEDQPWESRELEPSSFGMDRFGPDGPDATDLGIFEDR